MRATTCALLAAAAIVVTTVPAFAQDGPAAPLVTVITNQQFCELVAEDPVACESIIEGMASTGVVPEAFLAVGASDPDIEDGMEPAGDGRVGDTQVRDDLQITLLEVDWKPSLDGVFYKPGKGKKYVSALVEYEALEDGATYNITFWDATGNGDKRYEATVLGPIEPDLTVGNLAAGDSVKGWVTYEVPQNVNQLRVIESQVLKPDVAWNIKR